MTWCVRCAPAVRFAAQVPPAGIAILSALLWAAAELQRDVTITSAADGEHSGPDDPHHSGEAYDLRTHDLDVPTKQRLLEVLMDELTESTLQAADGGLLTDKFFGWIEDAGTASEHIHVQLRHGVQYP